MEKKENIIALLIFIFIVWFFMNNSYRSDYFAPLNFSPHPTMQQTRFSKCLNSSTAYASTCVDNALPWDIYNDDLHYVSLNKIKSANII